MPELGLDTRYERGDENSSGNYLSDDLPETSAYHSSVGHEVVHATIEVRNSMPAEKTINDSGVSIAMQEQTHKPSRCVSAASCCFSCRHLPEHR